MSSTFQPASAVPSVVEEVVKALPVVYGWIAGRVHCQDIRDICQDVALTALERLETFDPDTGALRAWLYGITLNMIARHHKRCRQECTATGDAEGFHHLPDPSPDAEVRVEYRDLLKKLTAKIPPSHRAVFFAHRIDGLTFEETAQVFHISAEAARKRDERAWQQFQAAWDDHQAEQRKLGAYVLPISALALVATIRAYFSHVPDGVLENVHAAIEAFMRDRQAPVSHEHPVWQDGAPVEAQALPACHPAPGSTWLASLSAVPLVAGILSATLLAAVPTDEPTLARGQLASMLPRLDALPIGAAAAGTSPEHSAALPAPAEADSTRAKNHATPSGRSSKPRAIGSMAFTLLHQAHGAANRGDADGARRALTAYDARYPHDPFPAARTSLVRRIAALARRSSTY